MPNCLIRLYLSQNFNMKNAIFIHAANMRHDVTNNYSLGLTQQILDRISHFIMDSKIYEDVDSINLGYVGVEGLEFKVPKATITYHDNNIYKWEFPTLMQLIDYCKENPDANVCYLHTQAASQGFYHPKKKMLDERRDYHLYWNVTRYKEALEYLKKYDTCGAMLVPLNADLVLDAEGNPHITKLHDNPVWHYSQNFWWSTAKHINTLPNPQNYPLILDERHQAEFWLCSSTQTGNHACINQLYESWCYAENFAKDRYMKPEDLQRFI